MQIKMVEDGHSGPVVNTVNDKEKQLRRVIRSPDTQQSSAGIAADDMTSSDWSLARPMIHMTCNKCHKSNHFTVKCRSKKPPALHPVTREEDPDEDDIFQMSVAP